VALGQPDWSDHSHSLAFTAHSPHWPYVLQGMFNAYWEPLAFELPRGGDQPLRWHRLVDTALSSPDDFCAPGDGPPVTGDSYHVQPWSCVLLLAPLAEAEDGSH